MAPNSVVNSGFRSDDDGELMRLSCMCRDRTCFVLLAWVWGLFVLVFRDKCDDKSCVFLFDGTVSRALPTNFCCFWCRRSLSEAVGMFIDKDDERGSYRL